MGSLGCGKGAQMQNAFFYMAGIAVVLVVLIIGIMMLGNLRGARQVAGMTALEHDIQNDILSLKTTAHGTQKTVEYDLPAGVDEICFVDMGLVKSPLFVTTLDSIHKPVIKEAILAQSDENVFIFKGDDVFTVYIENLSLNVPFSCLILSKTGTGGNAFMLENQQKSVVVHTPVNTKYCESANEHGICGVLDEFFYDGYAKKCHEINNGWCAP